MPYSSLKVKSAGEALTPDGSFYTHLTIAYRVAHVLCLASLLLATGMGALYLLLPASAPTLRTLMRPPSALSGVALSLGLLSYLQPSRFAAWARPLTRLGILLPLSIALSASLPGPWHPLWAGDAAHRLTPLTCGLLALSALALAGLTQFTGQQRGKWLYFLCLPLAAGCLAISCSYLYQLELQVGTRSVLAIFPFTAVALLSFNLAVFFAWPTNAILRQFCGSHVGSKLARRFLTHGFGAAVTLGFLGIELQRYVGLRLEDATALLLMALLLLFGAVIWHEASLLNERSVQTQKAGVEREAANRQRLALIREIQEERRRLAGVMRAATSHSIIATDALGTITVFNQGASRMLGYAPEEVIGKHTPVIFHDPECVQALRDQHPQASSFAAVVAHSTPEASVGQETTYIRKDGARLPVMLTLSQLRDERGALQGYIGIALDLTEQKRQQRELHTFFSLGHELLCIVDFHNVLRLTNPAFESVLGYSPEQMQGKDVRDYLHPDDLPAAEQAMETLIGGQMVTRFKNRWRHSNGSYRYIMWNSAASEERVYASGWDVTEEEKKSQEKARHAQFEKQLIGIVSHDLRNPVSAILMSAESIDRLGELSPRAGRSLKRIAGAAQRAERMIHDLLDFTQARLGGGLRIHAQPVDINQVAQQVVEEIQLVHPTRQIAFHPAPQGKAKVDGDRIAQVLGNLLSNAVRYSPRETPVDLTIEHRGNAIALAVHNGGDPIPEQLLPRLFQPLHRGADEKAAQSNASRSVGLGLYIVDQAVRAHGGKISVASTREAGTTFSVVLPQDARPS